MSAEKRPGTLTGKHVAIGLFLMFVVVSAVNGGFIFASLQTFAGLTSENAYYDGLEYDAVLDASRRQQELGWTPVLTTDNGKIRFELTDGRGDPLGGLTVGVMVIRPAIDFDDVKMQLVEVAAGVYEADFTFPAAGKWRLELRGALDGQPVYRLDQLLVLPE